MVKMVGRRCRAGKREDGEDGQYLCGAFGSMRWSPFAVVAEARAQRQCAQRTQIREKFLAARASGMIAKFIAKSGSFGLRAKGGGERDRNWLHWHRGHSFRFLGLLVNSETRHREELQPNLLETQELKR